MNFEHLKKHAKFYYPVIALDTIISHKRRKFFERVFFYLTIILALFSLEIFFPMDDRLMGALLLSGAIWSMFFVIEAFFYSHYFGSELSVLGADSHSKMTYELAEIIFHSNENHITQGFLESKTGKKIFMRLGMTATDIDNFLTSRKNPLSEATFEIKNSTPTLESFVEAIISLDKEFSDFLLQNNIKRNDVIGASGWVERTNHRIRRQERWWDADRLARVKGIGKKWAYGNTFVLEQYGKDITESRQYNSQTTTSELFKDEIDSLEAVLAKNSEANALLISEYGKPNLEVVSGLAREIRDGSLLSPLEHKRIISLDFELLIANNGSKNAFENECIRMFNEIVRSGNVIVLVDDLPSFIASSYSIGVDVMSLIDDYIAGSSLQMIAMSDKNGFEKIIRPNEKIMQRFESIKVPGIDEKTLLKLLLDRAVEIESTENIFFTYQSLSAMVESAERYYVEGSSEDKVADFLSEITPRMIQRGQVFVTTQDVYEMVTEKTGVPMGEASDGEKQRLGSLEEIMAKRVVGQKEAIIAISDAMRRNRSGISNTNRPIGSFLFLGPTGVGKTESAKALAEAIFGNNKRLMRLDMSEFNTPDSLNRLIGTIESDSGILTKMIRENPHGVLLIDEFEKTDFVVQNLFLQILDEGVFSDAQGNKVNARNIIFIATTNAGSDLMWEYAKSGESISDKKPIIIDSIVKRGLFKPELINRFDGAILFHPLTEDELRDIAKIMLGKLKERLLDQNIDFQISDEAINLLVKEGSDPQFGARPLNRAIQDKIESVIAKEIISGNLRAGMTYEFKG